MKLRGAVVCWAIAAGLGCSSSPLAPLDSGGGGAALGGDSGASGDGASGSGGEGGTAGGASDSGAVAFGTHCATCHGEQGIGSQNAPDVQHPIRDYATWVVRNGRATTRYPKPMPAFAAADVSDAALTLILDYLDTPRQPTTGQGLYRDYCANCHGADARSGPARIDLTSQVDAIPAQVRSGASPGLFDQRDAFMPAFPESRISDAEIQLIQQYVASL